MSDRLFSLDEVPEVPIFRPPAARKGARSGWQDERLSHDYPPEWERCTTCAGHGKVWGELHASGEIGGGETVQVEWRLDDTLLVAVAQGRHDHDMMRTRQPEYVGEYVGFRRRDVTCPDCLGMGSLKARVRLEAGHRCVRCKHPYIPKGDAAMLNAKLLSAQGTLDPDGLNVELRSITVEPSGMHDCETCGGSGMLRSMAATGGDPPVVEKGADRCPDCKGEGKVWTPWSACDDECRHDVEDGDVRARTQDGHWIPLGARSWEDARESWYTREAEYRILTVHHLDGDKANVRWWNLAALCQRCHLEIQARVVMDRVYPYEHSKWFRPYAAGFYAFVYLCKTCGVRLDWRAHSGPFAHPPRTTYLGEEVTDFPHRCEPGLELSREQVEGHMERLLALERTA